VADERETARAEAITQPNAKAKGMTTKNPNRQERLAAALRENLKRRKARARTLAQVVDPEPKAPSAPRPNTAKKPE
jgi:hypothetical protein